MRLVSWNVNSLAVRWPQVERYLKVTLTDVLALQELKSVVEKLPREAITALGYQVLAIGQKTYNGVALLAPLSWQAEEVLTRLPGFVDDAARFVAVRWQTPALWTASIYVPNGQAVGSDAFAYKLAWLEALQRWLATLDPLRTPVVVMGDANIAPTALDAHPDWPQEAIHVSSAEREAWQAVLATGMVDAFRHCHPETVAYSWWDYRQGAFRRNFGLRIDHVLVSAALLPQLRDAGIDREPRTWERPSDHTPVWAMLDL